MQSANGHESDSSDSSHDSEMDDDDDCSSESSNSSHGEEEDESESEEEEEEEPESDEEQEVRPPLSPTSAANWSLNNLRKRVKASKKSMPPKQVQRTQEEGRQKHQVAEIQSKQEKEPHHHAKESEKQVSGKMAIEEPWFSRFLFHFLILSV